MGKIKIDGQFDLDRGGKNETSFIQNSCTQCGWIGQKHYAYNNYQHSNCKEERQKHRTNCTEIKAGSTWDERGCTPPENW